MMRVLISGGDILSWLFMLFFFWGWDLGVWSQVTGDVSWYRCLVSPLLSVFDSLFAGNLACQNCGPVGWYLGFNLGESCFGVQMGSQKWSQFS